MLGEIELTLRELSAYLLKRIHYPSRPMRYLMS